MVSRPNLPGTITAKKDYSNGLSFLVGYTLSRQFTNVGTPPGFSNTHITSLARQASSRKRHKMLQPGWGKKAPSTTDIPQRLLLQLTRTSAIWARKAFQYEQPCFGCSCRGMVRGGYSHLYGWSADYHLNNISLSSQPSAITSVSFVRPNLVPRVYRPGQT